MLELWAEISTFVAGVYYVVVDLRYGGGSLEGRKHKSGQVHEGIYYPKQIWNGYPHPTDAAYGIVKRALITQGQAYHQEYGFNSIHLLLTNLYGPGDDFNPEHSHIVASIIRKTYEAKVGGHKLVVWGHGNASRQFLYVDDAAEGICMALHNYDKPAPINLGPSNEVRISELTRMICSMFQFKGDVIWDETGPAGRLRRVVDVTAAKREFGFTAGTSLLDGLKSTVDWYLNERLP